MAPVRCEREYVRQTLPQGPEVGVVLPGRCTNPSVGTLTAHPLKEGLYEPTTQFAHYRLCEGCYGDWVRARGTARIKALLAQWGENQEYHWEWDSKFPASRR